MAVLTLIICLLNVIIALKCSRSNLIDPKIEQAVARMQTAIELGRLIRDQKVIPIKVSWSTGSAVSCYPPPPQYPLPEVVVVQRDVSSHGDFVTLKNYILEVKE